MHPTLTRLLDHNQVVAKGSKERTARVRLATCSHIPPIHQVLDAAGNNIKSLPITMPFPKLIRLDVSGNPIQRVSAGSLVRLTMLEVLNLQVGNADTVPLCCRDSSVTSFR
jgi:Leucine-rich repeat (LRR) protein